MSVKPKFLLAEESVNATKHSEHKKIDKTVASVRSMTSKGLLHPLSKANKIGRKVVTRSKNVSVCNKTRQQKIEAVIHSVEVLVQDNNRLRLVCRYVYGFSISLFILLCCHSNAPVGAHCDPFWAALRSLTSHDCNQLMDCLRRPGINVESCDPDGNTLLHYATVLGRKDMVHLLYQRLLYRLLQYSLL